MLPSLVTENTPYYNPLKKTFTERKGYFIAPDFPMALARNYEKISGFVCIIHFLRSRPLYNEISDLLLKKGSGSAKVGF